MVARWFGYAIVALTWHLFPASVHGQGIEFSEVGAARGIGSDQPAAGWTSGLAAADFDDDGDIDVFVPTACGSPNVCYENDGTGHFTDVAASLGLDCTLNSRGALFFDYDGDGDLDLAVGHDIFEGGCSAVPTISLYQQQADGTFLDLTDVALDLPPVSSINMHFGGMCAGDINNDGFLDLCLGQWAGETYLLLNKGDGTFDDISTSSNVGSGTFLPFQPFMFDFDEDGLLDIYVIVDGFANHLWINQGDLTFVDEAPAAGCANPWNDMGITLGDYDVDGDFDMYITNIDRTPDSNRHNALFRNDSTPAGIAFEEVAIEEGCAHGGWGWGTTFLDADRDGRVDIAATNGFYGELGQWLFDQSKFFWNDGSQFEDASTAVNFDDTRVASALIAFDADRDGDLDMMQACHPGPHRLLDNQQMVSRGSADGFLIVKPRQPGPNRVAIGAIVRITIGEVIQSRYISAGTSCLGQEPAEAFFGVSDATVIDSVLVQWPDTEVTELTNVLPGQVLTINRPAPTCDGDANGDNAVNLADLLAVLSNWGGSGPDGDPNSDGLVNLSDLLLVLSNWGADCD